MSEFCNKCNKEMFGDQVDIGIDIKKEFKEIEDGKYRPVLCEGCGMRGIANVQGQIEIAYPTNTYENLNHVTWISYEEYQKKVEPCKLYDPVNKVAIEN